MYDFFNVLSNILIGGSIIYAVLALLIGGAYFAVVIAVLRSVSKADKEMHKRR